MQKYAEPTHRSYAQVVEIYAADCPMIMQYTWVKLILFYDHNET